MLKFSKTLNRFLLSHLTFRVIFLWLLLILITQNKLQGNDTLYWQNKLAQSVYPDLSYFDPDSCVYFLEKANLLYSKNKMYHDIIKNYKKVILKFHTNKKYSDADHLIEACFDSIQNYKSKNYFPKLDEYFFDMKFYQGQALFGLNKYEKVLKHFENLIEEVKTSETSTKYKNSTIAYSYEFISSIYNKIGRHNESITSLKNSFRYKDPGTKILAQIANYHYKNGEFNVAKKYATEALETTKKIMRSDKDNNQINNSFIILFDYFRMIKDDKTILYINESLNKRDLDQRETFLFYLKNFKYHEEKKDSINISSYLDKLSSITLKDIEQSNQIKLFKTLVEYYIGINKFEDAELYLQKIFNVIKIKSDLDNNIDNIQISNINHLTESLHYGLKIFKHKFKSENKLSHLDDALVYASELYESIKITRSKIRSDLDKKFSNEKFKEYFDNLIEVSYLKKDHNLFRKYLELSKNYSISFTRLYRQYLAENDNNLYEEKYAQLYLEINNLEQQVKEYPDSLELFNKLHDRRDLYFDKDKVDTITAALERNLLTNNEKQKIQSSLKIDESILSYYVNQNELYSVYIQSDTVILNHQILPENFIDTIKLFSNKHSEFSTDLKAISKILLPAHLKENIKIIPHGILNHVPFEALLDKNDELLLYNHVIHYDYIVSPGNEIRQNLKTFTTIAPNFSGECKNFEPLTYNIIESKHALNCFKNGNEKSFTKIRKDSFIQICHESNILHFGSHTVLDDHSPYRSFLALGEVCDTSKNDYRVFIKDILSENFSNEMEMIVLSSCDSGNGQMVAGEGLESLSKAFLSTNVESVISTLWAANDKPTSKIVEYFYKYLSRGERKDKALQLAKIKYLKNAGTDEKHPFYWAGFVPFGNMRPVVAKPFPFIYVGLGLVGICFLSIIYFKKRKKRSYSKAA